MKRTNIGDDSVHSLGVTVNENHLLVSNQAGDLSDTTAHLSSTDNAYGLDVGLLGLEMKGSQSAYSRRDNGGVTSLTEFLSLLRLGYDF